jgi:hypothetical protein
LAPPFSRTSVSIGPTMLKLNRRGPAERLPMAFRIPAHEGPPGQPSMLSVKRTLSSDREATCPPLDREACRSSLSGLRSASPMPGAKRRNLCFLVRPETLLRRHRRMVACRWIHPHPSFGPPDRA